MEVLSHLNFRTVSGDLAISLGNFDGFHLGHRELINKLLSYSKEMNTKSGIITFNPHPMEFFSRKKMKFITPVSAKVNLAKTFGLDYFFLVPFDQNFSKLSPENFVESFLLKGNHRLKRVFVGFNYHFGYKATGNPQYLLELGKIYNFEVEIIPPFKIDNKVVNSTLIKHYIREGRISQANRLLGRNFSISGTVVHGDGLGRILGFPTANIKVSEEQIIPANGVYIASAIVDKNEFLGVLNIGQRPTFQGQGSRIEIHLIDFSNNLYGKNIEVFFKDRLRDEIKFSSKELLIEQVRKDIGIAKAFKE